MTTEPALTQPVSLHQTPARVVELPPASRALIAGPVGAIVTGTGHAFAVELLDLAALPVRVRCQQCPWQATATGLAAAATTADRHAAAHLADPR